MRYIPYMTDLEYMKKLRDILETFQTADTHTRDNHQSKVSGAILLQERDGGDISRWQPVIQEASAWLIDTMRSQLG